MESVITIAKQLLIMFFYMSIGFVLFKKQLITKEGSKSFGNLLLYVILPCVVIYSFCVERTAQNTWELLVSLSIGTGLLAISIAIAAVVFRKRPIDNFSVAFSNAGFMGFPLITAFLGAGAVFYAAGFVAILNTMQWTYGQWVLSGGKKQEGVNNILRNPVISALIIGLAVFFLQIPIPDMVSNTMSTLTALNGPLAMIILGTYMAQVDIRQMLYNGNLYWVSAVRLFIIPLVSLALLMLLPQQLKTIKVALLIAAIAPVGSNVSIFAQKLNLDYTYAVQIVCVSTLLSIFTIPIILYVIV